MFANQYEEHLAHSAPCSSQWDGFDRGDSGRDVDFVEISEGNEMNPNQELVAALQALVEQHEKLLIESRTTKRDEAEMRRVMPILTGEYHALIKKFQQ